MIKPLVIFDCDGVLVDSEVISLGLLIENYASLGIEITMPQACDLFLGKPVKAASNSVFEHIGKRVPEVDLKDFQSKVLKLFRCDLKAVKGIDEALKNIPNRKCVASSSNIERIKLSLQITNLNDHFSDNLFSTDFVKQGKPHPDIFLYACEKMGGISSDTIVVEDSPAGITAAKAAGMKTIAFTGGSHAKPANLHQRVADMSPDIIISEMKALPEAIRFLT